MKFSTKAIRVGQKPDPATGAVILPIHPSTTFIFDEIDSQNRYDYSRSGNPTRSALEECLASLEEGAYGLAFASGMAATNAVLSLLRPGDHIVATEDIYGGTYRLLEKIYADHSGISVTYADMRDPALLSGAIRAETKMVWLESPTNPLLHIADIAAISEICREKGVILAVDNTFATPYLQQPLVLGADIVIHSTTKYINGHSDVIGGAVVTNDSRLHTEMKFYQNAAGSVPSPFDCWLTLRGVKTLAVRMDRHQENAQAVAEYLQKNKGVESVRYPGLRDHPQHEIAKKQMRGFGGVVTFQLRGGREKADAFLKSLKIFSFAVSLGAVESLAGYPATMTHGALPREERELRGITDGTIRLSIGLEDKEDLIFDLDQALKRAGSL